MSDSLNKNISEKRSAISSDAFLAKKNFDTEKESFDSYNPEDFDDADFKNYNELSHEIKLLIALLQHSKFDDIVHLIANPARLMGLNFIIGFLRGLGFSIALLIIVLSILFSLSDTVLFSSVLKKL